MRFIAFFFFFKGQRGEELTCVIISGCSSLGLFPVASTQAGLGTQPQVEAGLSRALGNQDGDYYPGPGTWQGTCCLSRAVKFKLFFFFNEIGLLGKIRLFKA